MPATLPAGLATVLAQPELRPEFWLEIEGLPYAYGTVAHEASFFSGRSAVTQRRGVKALLVDLPSGIEQEARPLEGTSSIGQLVVEIVDDGTEVMFLLGSTRVTGAGLDADLAASDAGSATVDAQGVAADFASVGDFYIGRESFSYTSRADIGGGVVRFSGVQRCAYRLPDHTLLHVHTEGDVLTAFPRAVKTRRAALYCTLDGTLASAFVRWAGTIQGLSVTRGMTAVQLTMESIGSELQRNIFGRQRRAKLRRPVTGADGATTMSEENPTTGYLDLEPTSITGADFVDGEATIVRVGDEFIACRMVVPVDADPYLDFDGTAATDARGVFNSTQAEHSAGDEVVEVLPVMAHDATGTPVQQISEFVNGEHPLTIALTWLLSRTGDASNSDYDTLTGEKGLGIDQGRVDIAGIERVRDLWLPGAAHREVIEELTTFSDWLAAALRPHACYPVHLLDGRFTIRRMTAPIPGMSVRTLDVSAVLTIATWESYVEDVVGRVTLSCDYDPGNTQTERGPYRQFYKIEYPETQELYDGAWREHAIEARGQWSGNVAISSTFGVGFSTDADIVAQRLAEVLEGRVAHPLPALSVQCDYSTLDVEEGELVFLDLDHVPNVATGARGLSAVLFEVVKKTIDDRNGKVTFTVLQTPYGLQGRLRAPSAIVASVASNAITVQAHAFSPSSGDADAASFAVGDKVAIWTASLGTKRGASTVMDVTGNVVTVSAAPAGTAAGDVLMPDDYASAADVQQAKWAFLAGSDGTFSNSDDGQEFVS